MKLIHQVHCISCPRISTYSLKGSVGEPAAGPTSPSASTRPQEFMLVFAVRSQILVVLLLWWVFVRLFACLLIRVSLCFLGWLFGSMVYVCLRVFRHLAHLRALLTFLESCFCFSCILGGSWNSIVTLGAPLCHPCWAIL